MTSEERFWAKVDTSAGLFDCWPWLGSLSRGYGHLTLNYRSVKAHRRSYELVVGPIPPGLQLDHLCRNRACVNPAHLEPVTSGENTRRSPIVGRLPSQRNQGWGPTHPLGKRDACKNGHPFDEVNTRRRSDGSRACRACAREWYRARHPGALRRMTSFQRHSAPGRAA